MYIVCYGKSPKALMTGRKLIERIGGRTITGTELISGSFVLAEGETECAIVMILPLDLAIKSMAETITDKTRDLPVIAVSPEGKYVAVIRRGNKPYDKGTDNVCSAIARSLGPSCFSDFDIRTETTNDLKGLVSRYNMAVSNEELYERINRDILNGGQINVYTDLPIVFADPVIDPMTYSLHSYPYELREDFIKQYKAAKEGKIEPAVFITCAYLGDETDDTNLILVPKLLSIGIEIKTKMDPGYCRPAIRRSLINHRLNPDAVAAVAATYSAKDSEIVTGIAEELGAEVLAFDSDAVAKAKVPMEMTFSPERKPDTATALALLASREGSLVIRRTASAQGLVFSVAVSRENIVLPE